MSDHRGGFVSTGLDIASSRCLSSASRLINREYSRKSHSACDAGFPTNLGSASRSRVASSTGLIAESIFPILPSIQKKLTRPQRENKTYKLRTMLLVALTEDLCWRCKFHFSEAEWKVVDRRDANTRCVLIHKSNRISMIGETLGSETVYAFDTSSLDLITTVLDPVVIVPFSTPFIIDESVNRDQSGVEPSVDATVAFDPSDKLGPALAVCIQAAVSNTADIFHGARKFCLDVTTPSAISCNKLQNAVQLIVNDTIEDALVVMDAETSRMFGALTWPIVFTCKGGLDAFDTMLHQLVDDGVIDRARLPMCKPLIAHDASQTVLLGVVITSHLDARHDDEKTSCA